ncbi:acyltransferase [Streptomyces sp. NPDC003863]
MSGTEEILRLTVAALMSRSGERQGDLAAGLGLSQAQVSRKQSGSAHWSLEDVDLLAAHYGLAVLDLLAGPTHAVGVLRDAAQSLQPGALTVSPVRRSGPSGPSAPDRPTAETNPPAQAEEPMPVSPSPAETVVQESTGLCVLCGQPAPDELDGFPQHLSAEECAAAVAAALPPVETSDVPDVPVELPPVTASAEPPTAPAAAAPAAPGHKAPAYASGTLVEQITDRVHDVLAECGGEVDAAQAALIKRAIPDVMALLKASRVGGRYEHSEFPPTQDILGRKSQKGADEIWEGRPKWRNAALVAAARKGEKFEVTALDTNAAYLSALKAWLPIGQLREDTSGVHDPKKAGVHLITPADWDHTDLPDPLGNRMEPGELWVSESTLRLLLDCAAQGFAAPRSSTAPSSPAPRKPSWRRRAARSRKSARPRWPGATSSPSPT